MAEKKRPRSATEEQTLDIENIRRQLDMFDHRLDNIDSIVTAVAERLMSQPITLNMICPHCGKNIEIAIIGNRKPSK